MVSSLRPSGLFLVISAPSNVPKALSVFIISTVISDLVPVLTELSMLLSLRRTDSSLVDSSAKSNGVSTSFSSDSVLTARTLLKSTLASYSVRLSFFLSSSTWPTISSIVLKPSLAIYSLSSLAMKSMKFSTYSGLPMNLFLSSGFCVAIPMGQVSRLHTLIITQPRVTSGAVANPNSSAPRRHAIATSLPLISLPSVSIFTRFLRPFSLSVWCVSASPSSHGRPALCIELTGAAPVPPS